MSVAGAAAVLLLACVEAAGGEDSGGGGPAPLAKDANPLAHLPPLPKPHHSWYRYAKRSDNEATLVDYARITHSVPIVHNANQSEITAAVNLCYHADGCGTTAGCAATTHNCSLALNWSPYVKTMEAAKATHHPADPTKTTPEELRYLATFSAWCTNATRWAALASAANGREVRIGAVILDQEAFNAGADPNPDVRAALTEKNNAYYRAAQLAAPGAEIIQYNRGGWQICPPGEPTCPAEYRNGVQFKLSLNGMKHGEMMGEKKEFGYGSHPNAPFRFLHIQNTVRAVGQRLRGCSGHARSGHGMLGRWHT